MTPPTRTIVHLSDLHFGREDAAVVSALPDAIAALAPDVVAVSGDLTQRARRDQFRRARAFLDALPHKCLVVPGNHDVPLYNVFARTFRPLGTYRRYITTDLEPVFRDEVVWMSGIDTTRPSRWKSGHVRPRVLHALRTALAGTDAPLVRILVAHHPFDGVDEGGSPALTALVGAGIDVFLTGHLHASYAGHTAHRYRAGGRTAVVVEAGTAASTRLRHEPNAFNVLRVTPTLIAVQTHVWEGRTFTAGPAQQFARTGDGWRSAP